MLFWLRLAPTLLSHGETLIHNFPSKSKSSMKSMRVFFWIESRRFRRSSVGTFLQENSLEMFEPKFKAKRARCTGDCAGGRRSVFDWVCFKYSILLQCTMLRDGVNKQMPSLSIWLPDRGTQRHSARAQRAKSAPFHRQTVNSIRV